MEKLLKVEHVSKKYENQPGNAVSDVSFEVETGKIFVLAGESGSGKTTLLKLIAGLEDADSGKILLEDKSVTGPSFNLVPGHQKVKLVFQDFRLFPNITVYQNIEYFLRAYNQSYQQERIDQLLQLCKLYDLQHKYPRQLSGGEQQRVALARALADEPLVLLLDEPFSNMDVPLKQQLKDDLREILANSQTTALLVTHDASDALSMADSIAVMKNGQIVQVDTPQKVYKQPVSPYVARFFGTCNILPLQKITPFIKDIIPAKKNASNVKNTLVCIRAEHIRISTSGTFHMKGSITNISYYGAYYQVTVLVDGKLPLIFHTTQATLRIGESLPLYLDLANVHYLQA